MSQENCAIARRWFEEVWNQRRSETIAALSAPESVGHLADGEVRTPEEFQAIQAEFLAAFPDLQITIEDTVAQGENVVVRWLARGCHQGHGFGCSATGKDLCFRGLTWFRIRDGKILEAWDGWNQGALFAQLRGE